MSLLKSGDSILLDFDGELTDIEGLSFPTIGKLRPGMKEFLIECDKAKIKVWIWSARGNYHPDFPSNLQSMEGLMAIRAFMRMNNLPHAGIYTGHKPIGDASGQFRFLLDDKARHFNTGYAAISELLTGD